MPHLSVEHWEEAKQEVEPDCVGEVEADVPLVGEKDRKPFNSKWKGVNHRGVYLFRKPNFQLSHILA